jgi:hypothetical protein
MCRVESGLPDDMSDIATLKLFAVRRLHSMCPVAVHVRKGRRVERALQCRSIWRCGGALELSRRSKHTPTKVGDVGNAPHDMEARSADRGLNFCVFDQLCIGNRGLQEDMRENGLHVCVGAVEPRIIAGEDRGFVHCIPKLLKPKLRGVRCPYVLSSRRVPRPLSQYMPRGERPIPDGMGNIPAVSYPTAIAFYRTHCRCIVRHA